jgi:hypothetical protein
MKTPNRRARGRGPRGKAARPDLDVIKTDLARLRDELATLFAHLAAGPVEGIPGAALRAVGQIGGATLRGCEGLASEIDTRARALRLNVEQRPWSSVLAACALGVLAARLCDRRPDGARVEGIR